MNDNTNNNTNAPGGAPNGGFDRDAALAAATGKMPKVKNSFWIAGMRIFTWVGGALTLLTCIFFSTALFGYWGGVAAGFGGFVIGVIGGGILAFLSVGLMMIFLDLCQDVREIKHSLQKGADGR